jgi:hypothetical protein
MIGNSVYRLMTMPLHITFFHEWAQHDDAHIESTAPRVSGVMSSNINRREGGQCDERCGHERVRGG